MFTLFENLVTLAFGNAIIALLTNGITWNAVLGDHMIYMSLRPVKAYEPAGLSVSKLDVTSHLTF
jgi:hypothetical protein